MENPSLSLVIPAFNEARRLPAALREIRAASAGWDFSWECLVMVEASNDGTIESARAATDGDARIEVVDNGPQRGKGWAVRNGMLRARGEIVLFMDCDLSVPLDHVPVFVRHLHEHPETDVLIGNRQHPQSEIVRAQNWFRQTMGKSFNVILRIAGLTGVRDTQCGFKAFRQRAAREIFQRAAVDGFAFDVEALLLAQRLGLSIADLPVQWRNSPESHVRIVRDSVRMFCDALSIRASLARRAGAVVAKSA